MIFAKILHCGFKVFACWLTHRDNTLTTSCATSKSEEEIVASRSMTKKFSIVQSALSNHIRRISHRMTANHSKHSMSTWWLHSRLDKRYFTRLRIRRKDFFKMLRWANELSLTLMKFQPGYNFWFLSPVAWREHVDQDGGIGRETGEWLL